MRSELHEGHERRNAGFTLVELLVVVIILGILAAIAIPVLLNQREKAWDAAAKSDVKNMSTAEETYVSEFGQYTADVDALRDMGFSPTDEVLHCADANGAISYAVAATHASSRNYFYLDSVTGQLVGPSSTAPCDPV